MNSDRAILETAVFYLLPAHLKFRDYQAFRNRIMSAYNTAEGIPPEVFTAQKNHSPGTAGSTAVCRCRRRPSAPGGFPVP